jgi:hypothetical protein
MRGRLATALLAGCTAALAVPASSPALIQIDRGIAGVRLDNTRAEVRAALGAPASIRRGSNIFGPTLRYRYRGGITVFFQGRRRVTAVFTTGRGDRTIRGVGVGSSERAVRRRVPGVRCETIVGTRTCHTNDFAAGQRVTDFQIRGGKVRRVSVAFVID